MTTLPRFSLLCLVVCLFAPTAQAKRHKHHGPPPLSTPPPEPAALATEVAPTIAPGAAPSASLMPFLEGHLSKILTPLGVSAMNQPEVLASLKAAYGNALAAAPAAHKLAFQAAQEVCDALAGAMAERETAVGALHGSLTTRSSEAAQPKGGAFENQTKTALSDSFFVTSMQNNWNARAKVLRQNIVALSTREHDLEQAGGPWELQTPAAPVAATSLSAAPPPATTPAPAPESDPVVGQWLLHGTSPLVLAADHTITGDREGIWRYTCTTNSGRNYELHWSHKNWVDYMVLAGDGKTMDGKTRKNASISACRP